MEGVGLGWRRWGRWWSWPKKWRRLREEARSPGRPRSPLRGSRRPKEGDPSPLSVELVRPRPDFHGIQAYDSSTTAARVDADAVRHPGHHQG